MKNRLNIYCLFSKDDTNKDLIKQFDNIIGVKSIIKNDPLYIISMDKINGEIDLNSIRKKYPSCIFHYTLNDWIPERINCQKDNSSSKLIKKLENLYFFDKNHKDYCLLKDVGKSKIHINEIQTIIENKFGLLKKLQDHLTNNSGMYYYSEPINPAVFEQQINQIFTHFSKIDFLSLEGSSLNSLYQSTFNKLDYGLSIVSKDRTIIYTNKVRRIHFGNDIIGKKCYDVFVLEKHGLCNGCPMGKSNTDIFDTEEKVTRSEIHKLKDNKEKVYFISESASKLELINCTDPLRPAIEKFGINVVRDNSAKTIAHKFQKVIQKLNSYHDIIFVLKFAVIGGSKDEFINRLKRNRKTNNGLSDEIINDFLSKITYRDGNDREELLNFGFGRMRYFRNHINIFQEGFSYVNDPYNGDVLQVFASYSHKVEINDIADKDIVGKHIDFKIAKDCIINELSFDENEQLIENQLNCKNETANKFLQEIGINNSEKKEWYDIKMVANNSLLGYLAVDWHGRKNPDKFNLEILRYLSELVNFAAQAIQRAIDHKELIVTREITRVINEHYDKPNDLNLEISKILCDKLETLKCEIFSIKNNNFIYRDFLYYNNLVNKDINKKLLKILGDTKNALPNVHYIGKHMIGNVLNIIDKNFRDENQKKEQFIYNKCVSILNYEIYDEYFKDDKNKHLNKNNQRIEEILVGGYSKNKEKPKLQNCIIAPLRLSNKIIGAIKLTNNGNAGKLFFPIHEQRILYYVAEQLAIKTNNFKLIEREKNIGRIFNHFSKLQIDSENFEFNILNNWRNDIFELDNKIRDKIIFNSKILVNLVDADVLYYYGYDNIENRFVKKGKRLDDTAVRLDIWTEFMAEIDDPLDHVEKIKNKKGDISVFNKEEQVKFSNEIYMQSDKSIICFPIFVNNEVFTLLFLHKFNDRFSSKDFSIINTISNQIAGVLQMAAFKRKGLEIMQNMSHQVIAPLSGSDSYMNLLIRNMLPEDNREYYRFRDKEQKEFVIKLLQSQVSHVRNIAKSIKYFTDIGFGNLSKITKATFSLTAEIIKMAALYQPIAKSQDITSIVVKNNENFLIYSDQILLFHIGICLIDNAIKYADKRTEIYIIISLKDKQTYKIQFINHGLIIPKVNYERIFDRDFRSANAERRNPHGSGIGLSLVKQFSNILGGYCYVEDSHPKKGTIITVEILKTL